jgi:chemosensory pili system protein ChpA (sensor histidine kinase/response regulator)
VPFREIETRLQRIVHRTASDLGKEAVFQLIGGDTKVDKTVLITLTDPLMHLLRNAVDHGIETPQKRRAAGKSPVGQITLTVARERSRVIIRLSDDGAGIDLEQVHAHAIERGLLSHDDPYDNDSLTSLLFTEGFSLSKTVTQISGRGVGLDIAQHAVRQLQGTIRVSSSLGYGTTFTISVPITLAITSALFVRSEGQIFAVPLEQITGVIRLEPERQREIEDQQVLRQDDRALMVYNLAAFVHEAAPCSVRNARYGLMIEQAEQGSVVLIDALLGTHDIVVKSLGTHLRRVHGVVGATVTGDGSVVLILDLLEVVGGKSAAEDATPLAVTSSGSRCVLVVDDSLSVRRVVCSFLERSGWQTIAAKDGIEALERIEQTQPDVALVDIEMPRMNGYELLASMRADPALSQIPVIFLTSRSADKHRERASQLGAAGYLVKPYQEFELLAELNRVTQGVWA